MTFCVSWARGLWTAWKTSTGGRTGGRFACRHCLDLSYTSCQQNHCYYKVFAMVAGDSSGEAFEAVKHVFSYQRREARRRRAEPSTNLLDAFEETFGEAESRR